MSEIWTNLDFRHIVVIWIANRRDYGHMDMSYYNHLGYCKLCLDWVILRPKSGLIVQISVKFRLPDFRYFMYMHQF